LERLEAAVWSEASVIPLHMTLTLGKFGGLFLGAFDDDEMIGFLYSFPGFTDGQPHLCSHMLGFLPAYRKRGLGVQMKWLQREEALKLGHTRITWTYDPLETVNAYLNIAKLGGIVRTYLPNCYGELHDEMNRGLPTDRFLVEWLLTSKRVVDRLHHQTRQPQADGIPSALSFIIGADGHPRPDSWRLDLSDGMLLIPVPAYFQQLKKADMTAAGRWRSVTRELFTHYFSHGYVVVDVLRSQTEPIVHYLLQKGADMQ
jgi:predicted GNAT superfamily acetyltransferase